MINFRSMFGMAVFALFACAGGSQTDRSEESEALQNQLLPSVIHWSETREPIMRLYQSKLISSFDYVCVVQEYNTLDSIKVSVPQVLKFHGSLNDGKVPEMKVAFIGVRGRDAHVSYHTMYPLTLYSDRAPCKNAKAAILVREKRTGSKLPYAALDTM